MGCFLFLITFVGTLIFSSIMNLSVAVDTISLAQSIRDGETLVSASQSFEVGFFTPGNSNNRYLGIWYKFNPGTVVWVANRKNPITDKQGMLVMSDDGNLVLLSKDKKIIWSTNSSRVTENPVGQLLDSGNLVIRDHISVSTDSYVWQSFDYPSDTFLTGMKLGWNLTAGFERYLTSFRSADDLSPGDFNLRLDMLGVPQLVVTTGSRKAVRSGPWNGLQFGAIPNSLVPALVHKLDELYYTFDLSKDFFYSNVIARLVLHQSGTLQFLVWNSKTTEWTILYTWPFDVCDSYAQCGVNNNCRINKTPICECLKGFIPKAEDEWDTQGLSQSRKCIEKSPSENCLSGEGFLKLPAIKLPDYNWYNNSMNIKECEAECFKNCSCRAYANSDVRGGRGCLMWFGDLIDIRECPPGFNCGQDIFLRVPASELVQHYLNKTKRIKIIAAVSTIIGIFILVAVLYIIYQWRRKIKEKVKMKRSQDMLLFDINMSIETSMNELSDGERAKGKSKDSWLPLFSFSSVSAATDNFSVENKLGEGGFGPVYKGKLLNGQEVAVKRLSRQSRQGLEELKNETMLIAKLQHRNLVRLLGCCIEHDEKILIYELMPNKSLDSFLFDQTKKGLIDWGTRVRIIEGIAQGLLYLHQYSRLRIIHRDLKASNILLDGDMNPKISDFGLARMFGGDELQANTNRIVGTYGYMSPEYAMEGLFSIKSDVFSFGILLLEILSSKKNTGFYNTDALNLLGHAWELWSNDRALDLMDPMLENEASFPMVIRYINVALLCVQEIAADRPTTSEVVSMLTNEHIVLPSPKQPAFSYVRSLQNPIPPKGRPEVCSVNNVTVSLIEAR